MIAVEKKISTGVYRDRGGHGILAVLGAPKDPMQSLISMIMMTTMGA